MVYAAAVMVVIILFVVYRVIDLRKAHSTFENYYEFRGCTQLLEKKADYGICKTSDGKIIKIIKYHDRWYLNDDLPICIFHICS